jgi:hypothetical protein
MLAAPDDDQALSAGRSAAEQVLHPPVRDPAEALAASVADRQPVGGAVLGESGETRT